MNMTRFAYQHSGHPLLSWKNGPPHQARAAESVSLGSLDEPTLVLPAPGAPEPINGLGCLTGSSIGGVRARVKCGCGCKGSATPIAAKAMEGIGDTIAALPTSVKVVGAIGIAYLLHKHLKKRR